MKRFFKTPTENSTKKRKHSINPLFLDKYGIADISVKQYVLCILENLSKNL